MFYSAAIEQLLFFFSFFRLRWMSFSILLAVELCLRSRYGNWNFETSHYACFAWAIWVCHSFCAIRRSDEEFMWGRAWHFKHLTPLNGSAKSITGIPLGMAWESFIESRNFNEKAGDHKSSLATANDLGSATSTIASHCNCRDASKGRSRSQKKRPEWGNKFSCENSQARHHNDLRKNMKMK